MIEDEAQSRDVEPEQSAIESNEEGIHESGPSDSGTHGGDSTLDLNRGMDADSQPSDESEVAPAPNIPGYEILGELGHGGMGVVFKARQSRLNWLVAIKMVIGGAFASSQTRHRFLNEADAVAKLQHPNIVQIYDLGEFDKQAYFVMEFVDGGDLSRHAQRLQPFSDSARLVETLARAIHVAHQHGVVHRDLKPANILMAADGCPKITDFGLAKQIAEESMAPTGGSDSGNLTATGQILGTPSYMAPEQASGVVKKVGPAADIYALGAILYELMTGQPPFHGQSPVDTVTQVLCEDPVPPRRLNRNIPRDLETIVLNCLDKKPERRFPSADELADDLNRWQSGEPIKARRQTFAYVISRAAVRRRRQLTASAIALLVILGVWYYAVYVRVDPIVKLRQEEIEQQYERVTRTSPVAQIEPQSSRSFVTDLPTIDPAEFEPVKRLHIWDLRGWRSVAVEDRDKLLSAVILNRQQRLRKLQETDHYRFQMRTTGFDVFTICQSHPDRFVELATNSTSKVAGIEMKTRQIDIDVSGIKVNQEFNVESTHTFWNAFQDKDDWWVGAIVRNPTLNISFLVIPPADRKFKSYSLRIADLDGPELRPYDGEQLVIEDPAGRYLFWECVRPRSGLVYRVDWTW